MSYPQKSSKAINPYVFYTTRQLKNKGLVQNLAKCRRPRATPLPSRSSSSSFVIPSKALVRRKSINLAPEHAYNPSTHEQFFSIIDILVLEAEQLANPLADWAERGRDQHQLRRLVHAEYEMRRTWSHHYNWMHLKP
ncbi:hypothetical protein OEA41_002765 [Lepraria neglecta]|uniref:Uncharacterized protein n=1 Tax=Lepraria neglecta TaxID=209136 RepID=A0AAE0DKY3_9LECA|nr:hypothetical protein OEA41_002765 [Lepraria neglecta]